MHELIHFSTVSEYSKFTHLGNWAHYTHSWAKGLLLLHQIIFNNPLLLVQRIKKEKELHIDTSLEERGERSQRPQFLALDSMQEVQQAKQFQSEALLKENKKGGGQIKTYELKHAGLSHLMGFLVSCPGAEKLTAESSRPV